MSENLSTWNRLKTPPPTALKTILAGRLKGMSDINPQWRYEAITNEFGLCGVGWKYEIKKLWTEQGAENQIVAFANVELFIKKNNEWSSPIPGIGGSMMVAKEKNGLYTSDESYKMAITDALSVAMKMIGVASDIYMGKWDGSKYREEETQGNKESVAIWIDNVNEASRTLDISEYRDYWGEKKEEIKHDCGTAGAAQVYGHYVNLGKKKALAHEKANNN